MSLALARGWGLAITDYQGLGTPGDHTYMVGRALGPNVLDAMRAARKLAPEELPVDGPAGIIGYSEGGAAAAWAAQLQPTYAPELRLAGVAAGAAAANVESAGPRLDGTFFSFFIAYGGIGYAAAYPELDFDPYLTPMARKGIEGLRNSTVLQAMISGPRFIKASDLTQPNVLELPEWRQRLRENRLGLIAPEAPVLLHHARRDQIVSFAQSVSFADVLAWSRGRRPPVHHARWRRSHQRRGRGDADRTRLAGSPTERQGRGCTAGARGRRGHARRAPRGCLACRPRAGDRVRPWRSCSTGTTTRSRARTMRGSPTGRRSGPPRPPEDARGRVRGGIFAVFTPSPGEHEGRGPRRRGGRVRASGPVGHAERGRGAAVAAGRLLALERAGHVRVARAIADLDAARTGRWPAGRRPAPRGRRGDRPRARGARALVRGRAALARAGVEPAERLRPRRAVHLPLLAGHRARTSPTPGAGWSPAARSSGSWST